MVLGLEVHHQRFQRWKCFWTAIPTAKNSKFWGCVAPAVLQLLWHCTAFPKPRPQHARCNVPCFTWEVPRNLRQEFETNVPESHTAALSGFEQTGSFLFYTSAKHVFITHNLLLIFSSSGFILTSFTLSFSFEQLCEDQVKGSACFQVSYEGALSFNYFSSKVQNNQFKNKVQLDNARVKLRQNQLKPAKEFSTFLLKL